jgi:hypothetical protein
MGLIHKQDVFTTPEVALVKTANGWEGLCTNHCQLYSPFQKSDSSKESSVICVTILCVVLILMPSSKFFYLFPPLVTHLHELLPSTATILRLFNKENISLKCLYQTHTIS